MALDLGTLTGYLDLDDAKYDEVLGKLPGKLEMSGAAMKLAAGAAAVGVGMALVGGISNAIEANAALDRLHEPHVVVGCYQGETSEHVLANPTAGDVRAYMLAVAVAVDRHLALERHDGGDLELSAVDQFIREVSSGILT